MNGDIYSYFSQRSKAFVMGSGVSRVRGPHFSLRPIHVNTAIHVNILEIIFLF